MIKIKKPLNLSIYSRILVFRETYKRLKVNSAKEGKSLVRYIDELSKYKNSQ